MLREFLAHHYQAGRALLLGVSGGPDSLALLFAMRSCPDIVNGPVVVAHMDHGWRPQSAKEGIQLEQIVASQTSFRFCMRRAEGRAAANAEDAARKQRHAFFLELQRQFDCQAVLLAHHQQDCAETVFKRVFEESSLENLGGLRSIADIEGLTIWRPFLKLDKKVLSAYVNGLNVEPVDDVTNRDPNFYRGKLRALIFPQLSQQLGRDVIDPLAYLGEQAQEFEQFLHERIAGLLATVQRGPFGSRLDLSNVVLHRLERRFLIRKFCQQQKFFLSREMVETISEMVQQRLANREFRGKWGRLIIDRGHLFALPDQSIAELPTEPLSLFVGEYTFGLWHVSVREAEGCVAAADWKSIWAGQVDAIISCGSMMGRPKMSAHLVSGRELGHWYTCHRVPAFLRQMVPVIWNGSKIAQEMLTGRCQPAFSSSFQVNVSYCPH